eukprot:SRR837773.18391.p2 GENE.SRR837773.18391~~SRR837773.18391.p2  ORF type:complete len:184 (+),score=34.49 SRR837773.18391:31-552(+)
MGESTWQFSRCYKEAAEMEGRNLTCSEFVSRHPEVLSDGYWSIERLDVFQHEGPLPSGLQRVVVDAGKATMIASMYPMLVALGAAAVLGGALAAAWCFLARSGYQQLPAIAGLGQPQQPWQQQLAPLNGARSSGRSSSGSSSCSSSFSSSRSSSFRSSFCSSRSRSSRSRGSR